MKHKKPAIAGYPEPDGPRVQGYLQQDCPATSCEEPDLRQGPSQRKEGEQYTALKAKLKSIQALIETVARKVSVSARRIVKTSFWKTTWFIGLAVTLCFVLAANTDPLRRLEWKAYDLGMRSSSVRPANEKVVVIAIDDASLDKFGPWPWSRAQGWDCSDVHGRTNVAGAGKRRSGLQSLCISSVPGGQMRTTP